MSEKVKIAIISGIFGVVCTLIAIFPQDIRDWFSSENVELKASWHGEAKDLGGAGRLAPILSYKIKLELEQTGKSVKGKAWVDGFSLKDGTPNKSFNYDLKGKLVSDEYLQLEYTIEANTILHYGLIFMKIRGDGEEMSGYYLAKNIIDQDNIFVFGEINFKADS